MRTSARNTLFGVVETFLQGAVNDEVTLRLPSGQRVTAVITRESAESLGLAPGVEAYALIKASSIIIATGMLPQAQAAAEITSATSAIPATHAVPNGHAPPFRLSARNQLSGTVEQIRRGAVNGEIAIAIGGGLTLTATITLDSIDHLALQVGALATALFKASSVIVGIKD